MLSAVAAAKQDASGKASLTKRIETLRVELIESAKEQVSKLTALIEARQSSLTTELRYVMEGLVRRAVEGFSDMAMTDGAEARKQLRDKDLWWKLKLETTRVAAKQQLANQTAAMEQKHEQLLRKQLLELQDDSGGALREALQRLEANEKEVRRLQGVEDALGRQLEGSALELSATPHPGVTAVMLKETDELSLPPRIFFTKSETSIV